MATQASSNVSADLVWQVARANNSFLVKRKTAGGIQLSKDPLNLTNINNRKQAGFVNNKSVGVQSTEKGGLVLTTKAQKRANQPASSLHVVPLHGGKSGPKVYRTIVNVTAKQGYRADLRGDAVARASRIRQSARSTKASTEQKPRGAKAKRV